MLDLHERLVKIMIEKLKQLIANTLKINASDIDDSFSLKTGKFKTSFGAAILDNIVKKVSGRRVDCKKVNTFGELTALLGNENSETVAPETVAVNEATTPETYRTASEPPTSEPASKEISTPPIGNMAGSRIVCGIDIQEIETFPDVTDYWTESFYTDNFTSDEIAYCVTAASPRHSFAGRWCAKEALQKCVTKYTETPFRDIQIGKKASGQLKIEVKINGQWQELGALSCSISHADKYAVGMVTGFADFADFEA